MKKQLAIVILIVAAIFIAVYFTQKPTEIIPEKEQPIVENEFPLKICNTPVELDFPEAIYQCADISSNDTVGRSVVEYYVKITQEEFIADRPTHAYLDVDGNLVIICGGLPVATFINDSCPDLDKYMSCDKTKNLCENIRRTCDFVSEEDVSRCYDILARDTKNPELCNYVDASIRTACIADAS